jgi:hypothetical protein
MKATIEKRRDELCFGLLNLYAQEAELKNQLSQVQGNIVNNITAINEMEVLLKEQEEVKE